MTAGTGSSVVGVVGSREERRGRNAALFRQVNERIVELDDCFGVGHVEILCECAELDCSEPIELTRKAYEEARQDATTFIVATAHVDASVERVVGVGSGYVVVGKIGDAAEAAAAITEPA
jgi:hypothetical protein